MLSQAKQNRTDTAHMKISQKLLTSSQVMFKTMKEMQMSRANTSNSFGSITKTFHWLTALLILGIIPLGVIANNLPFETDAELALKAQVFSWHKTLGVLVFFVALARILWASGQVKPGALHPERRIETFAAETAHWLLYISLVIVPLSGWIEHAATTGFAPIWWPFGQSLPFVPKNEGIAHLFASLHWIFGKVMIATLLLHIAGALKHHIIDRDMTLLRMWFGARENPVTTSKGHSKLPAIAAIGVICIAGIGITNTNNSQSTPKPTQLAAVTSDWQVESGEIAIKITQFGSDVSGQFADWTSSITFDPTPAEIMGQVKTTIAIGSLILGSVTDQAMGADYFDVAQFAQATFVADIKPDGDAFIADGTLTIKGISIPLAMPFTLDITDQTAEMQANITLDRRDFAIGLSQQDDSNLGFAVDVAISLTASQHQPQ